MPVEQNSVPSPEACAQKAVEYADEAQNVFESPVSDDWEETYKYHMGMAQVWATLAIRPYHTSLTAQGIDESMEDDRP